MKPCSDTPELQCPLQPETTRSRASSVTSWQRMKTACFSSPFPVHVLILLGPFSAAEDKEMHKKVAGAVGSGVQKGASSGWDAANAYVLSDD